MRSSTQRSPDRTHSAHLLVPGLNLRIWSRCVQAPFAAAAATGVAPGKSRDATMATAKMPATTASDTSGGISITSAKSIFAATNSSRIPRPVRRNRRSRMAPASTK